MRPRKPARKIHLSRKFGGVDHVVDLDDLIMADLEAIQ